MEGVSSDEEIVLNRADEEVLGFALRLHCMPTHHWPSPDCVDVPCCTYCMYVLQTFVLYMY
jgi:hypothetical protein